MRASIAWQIPALGVVVAAGAGLVLRELLPRTWGAPEEVAFNDLDPAKARHVKVKGVGHYESLVSQIAPAGIITDNLKFYTFAFMAEGEDTSREVRVIVRTQREPPRMVDLEYMTVEGVLSPLDPRRVPPATEDAMAQRGGFQFAEPVWLLEPVRIWTEDGEYVEP